MSEFHKTIFELEEGIQYHCNFYGDSVIFKRDKNRLMAQVGQSWNEHSTIVAQWRFKEIEGQRNLCPDCNISMEYVKNIFHVNLLQWYSGYRCPQCRKMFENQNDPHPRIMSAGKTI